MYQYIDTLNIKIQNPNIAYSENTTTYQIGCSDQVYENPQAIQLANALSEELLAGRFAGIESLNQILIDHVGSTNHVGNGDNVSDMNDIGNIAITYVENMLTTVRCLTNDIEEALQTDPDNNPLGNYEKSHIEHCQTALQSVQQMLHVAQGQYLKDFCTTDSYNQA